MRGKRIQPRLHFLAHMGHQFEVVGLGGIHFASQPCINEVESLDPRYPRRIIRRA